MQKCAQNTKHEKWVHRKLSFQFGVLLYGINQFNQKGLYLSKKKWHKQTYSQKSNRQQTYRRNLWLPEEGTVNGV